jgi:hypothetical protein
MSNQPEDLNYSPKSIGPILDRTLRLLRANLKLLIGTSALPPAVFLLALEPVSPMNQGDKRLRCS